MHCERAKGSIRVGIKICAAVLISLGLPIVQAIPASSATLDRVRETGKLMLGYRIDARPFSYKDDAGNPTGYSVTLCERIADEVRTELELSELAVEWVPVTVEERFQAVEQGKIDLLCSAETATLGRRKQVSFSLPIFPSGTAALLRSDASPALIDVLEGRPASGPFWRGSPARILTGKTFSAVAGTTNETWLSERIDHFQLTATIVPVESYDAGIARVLARDTDVFFGDRAILTEARAASPSASDLRVLERLFTYEPIALTLARGDEDFRLVVDRTLSLAFASDEFREVYAKWFGPPDQGVVTFFRSSALPE